MVTILKVLWFTTELTPHAKIGGLADVSTSLPKALKQLGIDIRIVLPYYEFISSEEYDITDLSLGFNDPYGDSVTVYKTILLQSTVPIYLINHNEFSGDSAYGERDDSVNLARRFAIFSWAAYELIQHLDWEPDVIHTNDWPTGPVALFNSLSQNYPSIFTIHNLAYQGSMVPTYLYDLGIEENRIAELIDPGDPDTVRYLRLGFNYCDQITTVSETYAQEILTPEYGYGLEVDMTNHPRPIVGVVHGIDIDEWDPEHDEFIHENYTSSELEKKAANKIHLQHLAGLEPDPDRFTIGVVSRLVYQKGINLLVDIIPELVRQNIYIIILGTGDPDLEDQIRALKEEYPDGLGIFLKYNFTLSHQVIAGVDGFVIPSRYEPCGLTQLYAMQYGTVPIVRKTGGLADTVSEHALNQTGFLFEYFDSQELLKAIARAQQLYNSTRKEWIKIQKNGMQQDLSWDRRAERWVSIYKELIKHSSQILKS